MTEIDHVDHEAIVAIDDGRLDRRRGAVRDVHDPPGIADFAIVVADGLQHMGLGTALAVRIVERARSQWNDASDGNDAVGERVSSSASVAPRFLRAGQRRTRNRA